MDQDSNGIISFSDFVTAGSSVLLSDANVEKAFKALDTKNDSLLDQDELQAAFSQQGFIKAQKDAIWNHFVAGCDHDQDGRITMQQFKQVMQNAMSVAGESNVGQAID